MMKLKKFVYYMEALDKHMQNISNTNEVLEKVLFKGSFVNITIDNVLVEHYMEMLADGVGDTSDDWIGWFVYENDFGRGKLEAGNIGGKTMVVDTAEKLYRLITA
jgi:hypothetical protein